MRRDQRATLQQAGPKAKLRGPKRRLAPNTHAHAPSQKRELQSYPAQAPARHRQRHPSGLPSLYSDCAGWAFTGMVSPSTNVAERNSCNQAHKPAPLLPRLSIHCAPTLASWLCPFEGTDLMWAHAARFEWSISFADKKLHLALKMLLSNALWRPVTILPT